MSPRKFYTFANFMNQQKVAGNTWHFRPATEILSKFKRCWEWINNKKEKRGQLPGVFLISFFLPLCINILSLWNAGKQPVHLLFPGQTLSLTVWSFSFQHLDHVNMTVSVQELIRAAFIIVKQLHHLLQRGIFNPPWCRWNAAHDNVNTRYIPPDAPHQLSLITDVWDFFFFWVLPGGSLNMLALPMWVCLAGVKIKVWAAWTVRSFLSCERS